MSMSALAIGFAAITYGSYCAWARHARRERLPKLAVMRDQWGERRGYALHVIGYTLVPICVGLALLTACSAPQSAEPTPVRCEVELLITSDAGTETRSTVLMEDGQPMAAIVDPASGRTLELRPGPAELAVPGECVVVVQTTDGAVLTSLAPPPGGAADTATVQTEAGTWIVNATSRRP